ELYANGLGGSGFEGGFVVGFLGHFADDFLVDEVVVGVDHKNGASIQTEFFNQNTVGFAEVGIPVIGEGFHRVDASVTAPAGLGKGEIHADDENFHVAQL